MATLRATNWSFAAGTARQRGWGDADARGGERKGIRLRGALLDEVTMQLAQGATLSGQVEFRNSSRPMQSARRLRVVPATPGFAASYLSTDPGLMDPTGKFTLDGLIGERCLRVDGLPPGWGLRDITHEGRDITNRILRFESGDAYTDVLIRIVPGEAPQGPRPTAGPEREFKRRVMLRACGSVKRTVAFLIVVVAAAAAFGQSSPPFPNRPDSVKCAVIGDNRTGDRPQYDVAQQMVRAHAAFPFDLVIMLGGR